VGRLTKRAVDAARHDPSRFQTMVWDSELKGFGLRISRGGKKSFILQYRNARGRSRRMTLGAATRLTAEQARRLAKVYLGEAASGKDPAEERREKRGGLTVAEFAEQYLEVHARPKKKPSSVKLDERLLRTCILPALGSRKLEGIRRPDVSRMHHAQRATPVQANRALLLLSKMMNLAESWGLRPDGSNPCRGVERFRERARQRYLSAEELARLGKVLAEAEREGSEHPSAILALRLLILTGARSGEILGLRWKEVDFERRALHLADSKTGEKTIQLSAPALELLSQARRLKGNPYVCTGARSGKHLVGLTKIWHRLRERAGLDDVRIHDLRHSYAAVGAGGGLSLPIIGALLGHSQPQTTARYAHVAADPLREAADQIAGEIASSLGGNVGDG
jgi:integrase